MYAPMKKVVSVVFIKLKRFGCLTMVKVTLMRIGKTDSLRSKSLLMELTR